MRRPPRSPLVRTRVDPGFTCRQRSARSVSRATSSWLTPIRSARATSGEGPGGRRCTRSLDSRSRRRPCQPSPTSALSGMAVAHSSPSSPAIGARIQPRAARHAGGMFATAIGSARENTSWMRPLGVSTFSKTGPRSSSTSWTSTPASRSRSSSGAYAASRSTPTSAAVVRPSRAVVRAL